MTAVKVFVGDELHPNDAIITPGRRQHSDHTSLKNGPYIQIDIKNLAGITFISIDIPAGSLPELRRCLEQAEKNLTGG